MGSAEREPAGMHLGWPTPGVARGPLRPARSPEALSLRRCTPAVHTELPSGVKLRTDREFAVCHVTLRLSQILGAHRVSCRYPRADRVFDGSSGHGALMSPPSSSKKGGCTALQTPDAYCPLPSTEVASVTCCSSAPFLTPWPPLVTSLGKCSCGSTGRF